MGVVEEGTVGDPPRGGGAGGVLGLQRVHKGCGGSKKPQTEIS